MSVPQAKSYLTDVGGGSGVLPASAISIRANGQ
jgi:hypothetical protein